MSPFIFGVFAYAQDSDCTVYQEENGLVVMEAENADYSGTNWEFRNSNPPGYTGTRSYAGAGYLEYRGANAFRNPDDNPLNFTFRIDNPGTYFMLIRGFKNHNNEANPSSPFEEDLNNDCWVRMRGNYEASPTPSGIRRFSSTDPDNGVEYNGASQQVLGRYTKLFMSFSDWYSTRFLEYDDPIIKVEPLYVFRAGEEYTLSIAGRSFQFDIDRIYIFRLYDESGNPDYTYQPRYEISGGGRNNLMGDTEMTNAAFPESNCVGASPISVTGLSVAPTNLALLTGESSQLTATISPANANDQTVTWTSSDPSVATVDANGLVNALAVGNTTITVTSNDGGFTATSHVTVNASAVAVVGISVTPTNLTLLTGESSQLTATISPANANDQTVTWTSSDPSVATVNANGLVNALAVGSTTITVTSNDGGFTATSSVTVNARIVAVSGISVNPTNLTLLTSESAQLIATIRPADASDQTVAWISSNPSIATVDANGLVNALAVGSTTITVASNDGGFSASVNVTVTPTVEVFNQITPNGDGIQDIWQIDNLDAYVDCQVKVFTRGGKLVYESRGYTTPWDGTQNGSVLPAGVYYYTIRLNSRNSDLSGYVTLIH